MTVAPGLRSALDEAVARGMPDVALRGQLLRPGLAHSAAVADDGSLPAGFWKAALAIQLAHEASLIHDDIVDEAAVRRGVPTLSAKHGTAKALVHGDHLLTAAYRLAAETGSIAFANLFAQCVERTVAGEIAQAKSLGSNLTWQEYRAIAESKSGELLGCALASGAALEQSEEIQKRLEIGKHLGLLYQMLDDLLDYCPNTNTGKPALGDFAQRRWTWVLLEQDPPSIKSDAAALLAAFRSTVNGPSVLRRCLERFESEAASVRAELSEEFPNADAGKSLVDEWCERARSAVDKEEAAGAGATSDRRAPSAALAARVPRIDDAVEHLSANSRSFRFASRFFSAAELDSVAHVYAYCRVTDDIVDRGSGDRASLLDEWIELSAIAYAGGTTEVRFLDRAMHEMSDRGIPFRYALELAEGMRMDLRSETYATLSELRVYTYRVASVVGLWLTELAGVHDEATLERAAALGHAMQMTNILRDVGEDVRAGRVYLPEDRMRAHGVSSKDLIASCSAGAPLPRGYPALVEELLRGAEADYARAFEAIPELPRSFQKPVAVAAHVYRGIHAEIRRRSYDNLRQRAVTSTRGKALLAARALWDLRHAGSVGMLRRA